MQPPRLLQKQPLVRRDGALATQNVVERRHISALRVAALHRLIELLRVAYQHYRLRRLRNRQHVGERHLRGFIHEQHVDRIERIRPRPQPGGSAADRRTASQRGEQILIALGEGEPVLRSFDFVSLLAALQLNPQFVGRLDGRVDQVTNDLVAVGGDADRLTAPHQFTDHTRAGEGLAVTTRKWRVCPTFENIW
jgi:hypothetical protein